MQRICAATLFALFLIPAFLFAKGPTVKIAITGAGLTTPIEITDSRVDAFQIFAGPGTGRTGPAAGFVESTEGFIIDWPKGVVGQLPAGLQHYEISFYTCPRPGCLDYIVTYAFDPASGQGFVYLPGLHDDAFIRVNHVMVHGHGFEGHWMNATAAWEIVARPLIARANAARVSR